ncbi:MAG: hypothetical protein GF309_06880 [Candidatus Lokiarchaeota archaeon]|nr:hypothetical protein [Candidatus Lokiarchaeota archaeon]
MVFQREPQERPLTRKKHRRQQKLREKLSDSVKVFWPKAKDEVMRKTKQAAEHLSELDAVENIWLFGSYVNDEFMHHSDVDLCVVLSDETELMQVDIMERVQDLKLGLTFELHIYRESEFNTLLSDSSSFVAREIVGKGIHLTA